MKVVEVSAHQGSPVLLRALLKCSALLGPASCPIQIAGGGHPTEVAPLPNKRHTGIN